MSDVRLQTNAAKNFAADLPEGATQKLQEIESAILEGLFEAQNGGLPQSAWPKSAWARLNEKVDLEGVPNIDPYLDVMTEVIAEAVQHFASGLEYLAEGPELVEEGNPGPQLSSSVRNQEIVSGLQEELQKVPSFVGTQVFMKLDAATGQPRLGIVLPFPANRIDPQLSHHVAMLAKSWCQHFGCDDLIDVMHPTGGVEIFGMGQ